MNPEMQVQRAAGAVAEMTVLLAVVSLPLYFTTLSENGYEAEKSILLRMLAALGGAALLVYAAAVSRRGKQTSTQLLIAVAAGVFAAYVLSTATSIDPRLSLWGSLTRQQGLVTRAAYFIVFLTGALLIRTAVQRQRVVVLLLFGSLPVVFYGLLQQAGIDPLPAAGDPNTLQWPVRSTLGQHIFLGSYLVMLIPFTAAVTWRAWRARPTLGPQVSHRGEVSILIVSAILEVLSFFVFVNLGDHRPSLYAVYPCLLALYTAAGLAWARFAADAPSHPVLRLGCSLLLLLQLVTLGASGARGAWLGAAAGAAALAFLGAWRGNYRRVWPVILGCCVAFGLFIVVLNVPNGPLQPLRTVPKLSRLANITDSGGAGGSAQGRLLIWKGVGSLMTHTPSIGNTWGGPLRLVVGYGPETMNWAFQSVFPLKLRQVTSENWTWDRAHNIFLDDLIDSGLLGLALTVSLFVLFIVAAVGSLRSLNTVAGDILVAAVAAVVGHLVDGFFGLETPVTLFLLWLLLSFALPERRENLEEADPAHGPLVAIAASAAVAGAVLLAWPGAFDHPSLLAAVWTAGIVLSVFTLSTSQLGTARYVISTRLRVVLFAVALALVALLGGVFQTEVGNVAERVALTDQTQGRTEQAINQLQHAVRANGEEPQFLTELAEEYLLLASRRTLTSGPVINSTQEAALTLPASTRETLSQQQLLALTQATLQGAQNLAPLDPDAAENLGNIMAQAGNVTASLAEYARARRLSSNNPRYVDRTADALLQSGRVGQAAREARSALQLDTTYWYAHFVLSLVDHRRGLHRESRSEAALALYWMKNSYPAPAQTEVQQARLLQEAG